jgi:hypothetical protein
MPFKKGHKGYKTSSRFKPGHRLNIGKVRLDMVGENNHDWKGDNAGYAAKHDWIRNHYGKAKECQNLDCNYNKIPKRYEWADVSGECIRNINNFIQLCCSCHRQFDSGKISIKVKPDKIGVAV